MTSGYIFTLACSLRVQVLCSRKFPLGHFGSSWWESPIGFHLNFGRKPTQPAHDGSTTWGCWWRRGSRRRPSSRTCETPHEAPDALRPLLDLLTKPLALILVAKQIPWVVQAKLAHEGYVTVEDLGDRWNTPDDARAQGFRDLEFQDGENNFTAASSRFTAMRLLQAVRAAKSMAQTQLHVGRTTATEPKGPPGQPL